jgi:cytochrome c biogenesis protein CcmG/thiol:disulfide interchange protein DsbE
VCSALVRHVWPWPWLVSWLAVTLLLLAFVAAAAPHATVIGPSARLDRPAPPFTLDTFGGRPLALSDLRGRPVVLNFWASWCGACQEEAPVLARAWAEYRQRGVAFVGVAIHEVSPLKGDVDHNPKAYAKRWNLTYQNGRDRGGRIAEAYRVSGVPETYFIDAAGRIVLKYSGPLTEPALHRHLADLLGLAGRDRRGGAGE